MGTPTLDDSTRAVWAARDEAIGLIAQRQLDAVKSKFLGRKGTFRQLQQLLGQLPASDRPAFGKVFHEAQNQVQQAFDAAQETSTPAAETGTPGFDFLPGIEPAAGCPHPVIQTIGEIADILGRMGFEHVEGPEVEDVFHNFVALNIPEDHPARDPRDNFYIHDDLLLRSQTSTVQIRVMQRRRPPIRICSIGRVYRPDAADATHSPMFHQVEGLWVDESVTLAHLKSVLVMFTHAFLGPEVKIRLRPSFFPFTEPSIEVDMSWGSANDRWIELGGAGMVDPNVFDAVGIDRERYSGFAFGLGIERLAMRRYGIQDMRSLFENDVRFLRQFV